jgi:peptidylprolyl isomerase
MTNPKSVIGAIVATIVLIAGLGIFVAHRNGEFSLTPPARVEDQEFPKALSESTTTPSVENDTTAATTSKENKKMNEHNPTATLKTPQGDIVLELYQDVMPITAGNFLSLAQKDFYDGTKFHRVIDDFMIQGGDPNSKGDAVATYGTGGPGYAIEDEFVKDPRLTNVRGTIAMANSGPHSGGSQFFINLVDNTGLDFDKPPEMSSHPVFGKVLSGMDIVDNIAKVPTNERDLPRTPVVITDVVIDE